MSAFPITMEPNKIEESRIRAKKRTPFEGGYVQFGLKHTRSRRKFSLTWNYMTAFDLFGVDRLLDHFDANQGGVFSWTHPDPDAGGTFTVGYSDDKIEYKKDEKTKRWSVEVNLEEL